MEDMDEAPVRRTRSGRQISESPAKTPRKGRKKVQVDPTEDLFLSTDPTDSEEMDKAFDLRQDFLKEEFKVEHDTNASETQLDTLDASMGMITGDLPEDSNSMTNEFNSFKGAESSSDAINNESNSCFEDGFIMSENGNHETLDNNIEMDGTEVVQEELVEQEEIVEQEEVIREEEEIENEIDDERVKGDQELVEEMEMDLATKTDPDAENISEDELPTVQAVKVPEAEEVSDEELPGPKRAELPADTENVSEEELETVKNNKRKLEGDDNGSPASENGIATKKPALEEPTEEEEAKEKPKKLPELDKYWKAVNDDPSDFTGWTYLLQYVDQENDMEAAREAYDAFLSHYPYCYGYWRKYADYEKRKGNKKKCEEVFERGLKAIPLSVDLWIHYLTHVRSSKPDDEEFIRAQFERSLNACGLEFRSDRLWENYIKWEMDGKRLLNSTLLYERLLSTPTQGYLQHFDNFQEHVVSNPPNKILEVDEFLALRKEVKAVVKQDATEVADNPELPPGEDTEEVNTDEETKAIRERIISIRRKTHKNTSAAVTARWNFEEGIKRPYFHVKPLERCQLKNWQDYLDYEISQAEKSRIIVLFERCLIACALYEEFWLKFVHYLQGLNEDALQIKIKDVYERACTIHHLKKPNIHLQWALFEESIQNYNKAAEILQNLEKSVPNLLQVAYRRINLERRRNDHDKCCQLYEHYINNSKNKLISTNMAIKYARFTTMLLKNNDKAIEIINAAIAKDVNNQRLYLQLIDLTLHRDDFKEEEVLKVIDAFLEKDSADIDQKVLFAQRKLEFLEDFGANIASVQQAYDDYQKHIKGSKESSKKKDKLDAAKKDKNNVTPPTASNSYNNYGNYGSTPGSYQYGNSQQGTYNQYPQYGQGDQYQYQGWQYQGNYGGYNQWGGYGYQ